MADDRIKRELIKASIFQDPWCFLACGLGAGHLPIMPGTWGTLAAVVLYLLLAPLPLWLYLLATLIVILASIYLCHNITQKFHLEDPGEACVDEFSGFLVTMVAVPFHGYFILAGFILFRLLDILKPWPISFLDRHVKGGLGMVLDDVLAGMMATMILHLLMMGIASFV